MIQPDSDPLPLVIPIKMDWSTWADPLAEVARVLKQIRDDHEWLFPRPADPREHALQARRNRNTGPDRTRCDGRRPR